MAFTSLVSSSPTCRRKLSCQLKLAACTDTETQRKDEGARMRGLVANRYQNLLQEPRREGEGWNVGGTKNSAGFVWLPATSCPLSDNALRKTPQVVVLRRPCQESTFNRLLLQAQFSKVSSLPDSSSICVHCSSFPVWSTRLKMQPSLVVSERAGARRDTVLPNELPDHVIRMQPR